MFKLQDLSTKELTEELSKRSGIKIINLENEESGMVNAGPLTSEIEGPALIIINFD